MSNMRFLTYCIYKEDGLVYSRMNSPNRNENSQVAIPVLDYAAIGKDGNFGGPLTYHLEAFPLDCLRDHWRSLIWTKKIPVELKNRHRAFWGMKPLKVGD
jgi:hypothetical protein